MNDNDDSTPTNAHTHRQTDKQTDERKKEGKKGGFHFSSHLISQGQKIPVSARMSNLFLFVSLPAEQTGYTFSAS